MRTIEIIIPLLLAVYLLWRHPRPFAIRLLPSAAIALLLLHIAVEGFRWQMIPLYVLTALLTISSLFKVKSSEDWKPLASYLTFILLALSYVYAAYGEVAAVAGVIAGFKPVVVAIVVEAALKIAETGHLTFATLHTNSAAQTINRIIDIFPANQQAQIRTQLSLVLEGIVCQALLPRADGQGRVVSLEILVPTPAIRNLIRDDKVHQIYGAMQAGQEKLGMQTGNQSLASLYHKRLITLETALGSSSNRDELQEMISRGVGVVPGAGMGRAAACGRRRRCCFNGATSFPTWGYLHRAALPARHDAASMEPRLFRRGDMSAAE